MFEYFKKLLIKNTTNEDPLDKMNRMKKDLGNVVESALDYYNEGRCPCCYPRFLQMISIDSCDYERANFECFETESFVRKARRYFDTSREEDSKEAYTEEWICKKCGSQYESSWHNFSESVHHHVLKPVDIRVEPVGNEAQTPIPLYIGLAGLTFPKKEEFKTVGLEKFKDYILER